MSLATQIIDQQVSGIIEKHEDTFANELRLGEDEQADDEKISFAEIVFSKLPILFL